MELSSIYSKVKQSEISGRYLTNDHVLPILEKFNTNDNLSVIGSSVLNKPIYQYSFGQGSFKILMWSQMHGNESTTTKAVIDLIAYLNSDHDFVSKFSNKFQILIIPILNPDGAEKYTRVNANQVDLNRDSENLTQPESNALRKVFDDFQPDLCLNLHDQRTIFGVADTDQPATISFLAPSYDISRKFNDTRLKAISVITYINEYLQTIIPGKVGRFDDSFNINCIGDQLTSLGTPTILFEAGHYPDDYDREMTRKIVFFSFMKTLIFVYENDLVRVNPQEYQAIGENNVKFFDIIFKNIKINYANSEKITNFAVQFTETLSGNRIELNAFIVKIGNLDGFLGHSIIDCNFQNLEIGPDDNIENFLNRPAGFRVGNIIVENGKILRS